LAWKWFDNSDFATEEEQFDIPLFIYNELAYVCTEDNYRMGTYLLQDNEIGLRTNLCAKELFYRKYPAQNVQCNSQSAKKLTSRYN